MLAQFWGHGTPTGFWLLNSRFSIGNGSPFFPPGKLGHGSSGVVVVTSTSRYSTGSGRASLVTSLPYSLVICEESELATTVSSPSHPWTSLPCRRHLEHTAVVRSHGCSRAQVHRVLGPGSRHVPVPCPGWIPGTLRGGCSPAHHLGGGKANSAAHHQEGPTMSAITCWLRQLLEREALTGDADCDKL